MSFAYGMSNTTGGLANLWCEKCKAEVLHRGSTCNHCGSTHVAYPVRSYADIWVSGLMSVKRRRRRK